MASKSLRGARRTALSLCLPLSLLLSGEMSAQAPSLDDPQRHACARPAENHADEAGCFYDGSVELGIVAGPRWWHIDEFPDIEAAKKAATSQGHAHVIFGRALLQTVNDKADWAAPGGRHVATVGPVPIEGQVTRTARFMEATFTEGMTLAVAHRHSGPEAWYVFEGAQCLESPHHLAMERRASGCRISAWMMIGTPTAAGINQDANGGNRFHRGRNLPLST
jgi:hypothetical protein